MKLKQLIPEKARAWLFWKRVRLISVIKRIGHAFGLGKLTWKMSLPSEVQFWDDYIRTRGASCEAQKEFAFRTSPEAELQTWLRDWMDVPENSEIQALDVGAGPLTWIGKKWAGHRVTISAIDPLAETYKSLMQRYQVEPPVWTEKGNGEEVVELFGPDRFDLVFARNSLDHSYDAIKAVTAMIQAAKPGGIVFLWHNPDEAEGLDYQGLHQWNFRLENNQLLVWRRGHVLNVNEAFKDQLDVLWCELRDGMIQAVYRKRA